MYVCTYMPLCLSLNGQSSILVPTEASAAPTSLALVPFDNADQTHNGHIGVVSPVCRSSIVLPSK